MPGAGSDCRTPHESNAIHFPFLVDVGQRCRGGRDLEGLATGERSGATPSGKVSCACRIELDGMVLARFVESLLRFLDAFFRAFVEWLQTPLALPNPFA